MNFIIVSISKIIILENTRLKNERIPELMRSIDERGLLHPLVVQTGLGENKGKYILAAGNRRHDACTLLGWKDVAVNVVGPEDAKERKLINLTENVQRESLTLNEYGSAISDLIKTHQMTLKGVAARLRVSVSKIRDALGAYRRIPVEVRGDVVFANNKRNICGKIPFSKAHAVSKLFNHNQSAAKKKDVLALYSYAANSDVSTAEIKHVGKGLLAGKSFEKAKKIAKSEKRGTLMITVSLTGMESMGGKTKVKEMIVKLVKQEAALKRLKPSVN